MNVVLVEPRIPQNTGNIARLCAATGASLHLVGELGFKTDDRHLKRAGLDYWKHLDITYYESISDFERRSARNSELYLLSTKGPKIYTDADYRPDDYIIFGSETKGLSDEMRKKYSDNCLRIPMIGQARSLNLANCVGIVLYEALRQNNFFNCQLSP